MLRRFLLLTFLVAHGSRADDPKVDTSTLNGKVVCGYQGWFRCEGDGAGNGWYHYAANEKFEPGHAHIEMWPDVSELPPEDRFPTPFRFTNGKVAEVFSSVRESTVSLHFLWMQQHGIDGVFLQRFATDVRNKRYRESTTTVLKNCRTAAAKHGRGWALMYDLSGLRAGDFPSVMDDWKRLVDDGDVSPGEKDPAYFHHSGKPLVALWGLGFHDRQPCLDEWAKLVAFFKADSKYGNCSVMLGVPYHWRTLDRDAIPDPKLHDIIRQADILSPWSVGRLATPEDAVNRVKSILKPDLATCAEFDLDYLPVIFPGFSWSNLTKSRGGSAPFDAIPRRGGQLLWAQAIAARKAGAQMLYVAMFDELDEGTAIFKTTQDPPTGASRFLREESVPPDHYLWLTGQIARLMRGQIELQEKIPTR